MSQPHLLNMNTSLSDRVNQALKEAMKAQDEPRKRTIRAIKAQILLLKTDGSGEAITEEKEIKLLQKMLKQREESLEVYQTQGRADLAKIEAEEISILREFLPQMLSETEIQAKLQTIIQELGANSLKDLGKVMAQANAQMGTKAEGKVLAQIAKQMLNS